MTTACDPPRWRTFDLRVFHKTLVVYWHWAYEDPNSQPGVWFDCQGIT
jgi:hypothetical protein